MILAAIITSLAGAQEAATETVSIRRIPRLYDSIVANFEDVDFANIDFATQVFYTHTLNKNLTYYMLQEVLASSTYSVLCNR